MRVSSLEYTSLIGGLGQLLYRRRHEPSGSWCLETPSKSVAQTPVLLVRLSHFYTELLYFGGGVGGDIKHISLLDDLCSNHKNILVHKNESAVRSKLSIHHKCSKCLVKEDFPSTVNASFPFLAVINYSKIINFLLEHVRLTQIKDSRNREKKSVAQEGKKGVEKRKEIGEKWTRELTESLDCVVHPKVNRRDTELECYLKGTGWEGRNGYTSRPKVKNKKNTGHTLMLESRLKDRMAG